MTYERRQELRWQWRMLALDILLHIALVVTPSTHPTVGWLADLSRRADDLKKKLSEAG